MGTLASHFPSSSITVIYANTCGLFLYQACLLASLHPVLHCFPQDTTKHTKPQNTVQVVGGTNARRPAKPRMRAEQMWFLQFVFFWSVCGGVATRDAGKNDYKTTDNNQEIHNNERDSSGERGCFTLAAGSFSFLLFFFSFLSFFSTLKPDSKRERDWKGCIKCE